MPPALPASLAVTLAEVGSSGGLVLVLTGAGISAQSGIPTFRGAEGYWTVGSRNYRPEELATRAAFMAMPDEVWAWYLYRRAVCRAAEPNVAHEALARLDTTLGERLLLVTQNVDGLHLRAGSPPERIYEIHGNIDFARCVAECGAAPARLPDDLGLPFERGQVVDEALRARLVCPACGGPARPHVLWFDECYDETNFRFESSLRAGERAAILLVIGTSGATNLPAHLVAMAAARRIPIVVVGPEETPFARVAEAGPGAFLRGTATEWVPRLAQGLSAGS